MNEIIMEICAFCVATFCLIYSVKDRRIIHPEMPKGIAGKLKDQHLSYVLMLIILMVCAASSVLGVIFQDFVAFPDPVVLTISHTIYYSFHYMLAFVFAFYVMNVVKVTKDMGSGWFCLIFIPFAAGEIFALTNFLHRRLFYIDANVIYHRGDMLWLLYLVSAVYLALAVIFFFRKIKMFSSSDRVTIFILITITIMGVVLQAAFSVMVELFFEAIAFLGFMVLSESDTENEDSGEHKHLHYHIAVVISVIFLAVVSMNITMIYDLMTRQSKEIGEIQIDSIKGDLQEIISYAESNVLRLAMGVEQLNGQNASLAEIEEYIREQKQAYSTSYGGTCINVYGAASDWTIIPDFDMPADYRATERLWYIGAADNQGSVYVTEPYIDAMTNGLCFTVSTQLSDKDTVVAMDFDLSQINDLILRMADGKDQTALILTASGMIVGYSNMELVGEKVSEKLPEYKELIDRVMASNEHESFRIKLYGKNRIVFSNETANGWYLILCVDSSTLYGQTYLRILMMAAIDIMMVAVIVVFYIMNIKNRERAESALTTTEEFLAGITGDLHEPLAGIMRLTDTKVVSQTDDIRDLIGRIRAQSILLSEKLQNLFFYSDIIKLKTAEKKEVKEKLSDEAGFSRAARNWIVVFMVLALSTGFSTCLSMTLRWRNANIERQLDSYEEELSSWVIRQQSILGMFVDMIAESPERLDDYEGAVKWLDGIVSNYPEISVCYMANPYAEHTIIMNNGWQPEEGWKVEERSWYKETEYSDSGQSISAPYFDDQTGYYCVTFSKKVYGKNGEFLGIFGIDFFMDKLIDVLDESYSENNYAFMLDRDGNIINHPNPDYQMTPESITSVEDTEYAEAFHKKEIVSFTDYDRRPVSCMIRESEQTGFNVATVNYWWSIYGIVVLMGSVYFVMLIVCVTIFVILINRLLRWQERINQKLVEAADTAVSAGKAKSRFLAQMSHEIRTPINAVLGMNEMVLRESKDKNIIEYADNIRIAGKTLLSLINSILDFSKIEDGKMEIIPAEYDTAMMISGVVNSISERAKEKDLALITKVDENIPVKLFGDDMRISQVIMNLLTNAVKYTEKGSVTLTVGVEEHTSEEVALFVEVRDTGIGIKKEDREKLFESFTRLEEDRNRTIEGTGLGMSIVTCLLDMMGSKLNVESEYGKGSAFSFVIRQKIINDRPIGDYEKQIRLQSAKEAEQEQEHVWAPEARVLVVDDNEMNLKVARNLLKQNGIIPDMERSGSAALETLKKNRYDLVLLDHMMPKMDGIQTLSHIREENLVDDKTVIVALTANAVVGARERYIEAGFDDYLSKPIEIPLLEECLRKYLPAYLVHIKTEEESNGEEKTGNISKEAKENTPEKTTDEEVLEFSAQEEILEFGPGSGDEQGDPVSDTADPFVLIEAMEEYGFNTKEALAFCGGDPGFYHEMLMDFAKDAPERENELDTLLRDEDVQGYQVKVHSLKSAAKTVGDIETSELSLKLENAAKEGNITFIKEHHEKLMSYLKASAAKISGSAK